MLQRLMTIALKQFLNLNTFGPNNSLLWGAVLCIIACWEASLVRYHQPSLPLPFLSCDNQIASRYCQMLRGGGQVGNCPWLRSTPVKSIRVKQFCYFGLLENNSWQIKAGQNRTSFEILARRTQQAPVNSALTTKAQNATAYPQELRDLKTLRMS